MLFIWKIRLNYYSDKLINDYMCIVTGVYSFHWDNIKIYFIQILEKNFKKFYEYYNFKKFLKFFKNYDFKAKIKK